VASEPVEGASGPPDIVTAEPPLPRTGPVAVAGAGTGSDAGSEAASSVTDDGPVSSTGARSASGATSVSGTSTTGSDTASDSGEGSCADPRDPSRDALVDGASDESDSEDPVEPPEPRVSAYATGIDAAAAPIPNVTASAPTRPTYRAKPDAGASGTARSTAIGRTGMGSTPRLSERRRPAAAAWF
jgi:hypothetical protein